EEERHHIGPPILTVGERGGQEREPLARDFIDHAFRGISDAHSLRMHAAGPDAEERHDKRGAEKPCKAIRDKEPGKGQGDRRCDGAGGDRKIAAPETGRETRRPGGHARSRMVATACAAIPSRRPAKPRPSVVVALTLMRERSSERISASVSRIC